MTKANQTQEELAAKAAAEAQAAEEKAAAAAEAQAAEDKAAAAAEAQAAEDKAAANKNIVITFTKPHSRYSRGDIAGFPADRAKHLVEGVKVAVMGEKLLKPE